MIILELISLVFQGDQENWGHGLKFISESIKFQNITYLLFQLYANLLSNRYLLSKPFKLKQSISRGRILIIVKGDITNKCNGAFSSAYIKYQYLKIIIYFLLDIEYVCYC